MDNFVIGWKGVCKGGGEGIVNIICSYIMKVKELYLL